MADYIEREKYVKLNDIIETLEHEWGYEGMREDLYNLPTSDVVEAVRCKDCKFYQRCESSLLGEVYVCTNQGDMRVQKEPADFCSYGKKKEGAEE